MSCDGWAWEVGNEEVQKGRTLGHEGGAAQLPVSIAVTEVMIAPACKCEGIEDTGEAVGNETYQWSMR